MLGRGEAFDPRLAMAMEGMANAAAGITGLIESIGGNRGDTNGWLLPRYWGVLSLCSCQHRVLAHLRRKALAYW